MRTKLKDITIRRAETPADLEKLYRFRYAIYVEEMQRPQRYADHHRRRIEEPLDATAANFIALKGDAIVGCLRWNSGQDTDFGEYTALYEMHRAGACFPGQCSVTTKLMTDSEHRQSRLGIELCVQGFAYALSRGAACDFMDCNPHLEHFFVRFGYRTYRERIQHPEYGDVLPMVLLMTDHDHLAAVDSPFAAAAAAYPHRPEVVRYFQENVFTGQKPPVLPLHATTHPQSSSLRHAF